MKQDGMVMVIGLILMASISLAAAAAASGAVAQQHAAASLQRHVSLLAHADVSERAAVAWLLSRSYLDRDAGCQPGRLMPERILSPGQMPQFPEFESWAWWKSKGSVENAPGLETSWIIAEVHCEAEDGMDIGWYRILTRSQHSDIPGIVVAESIYARPWGPDIPTLPFLGDSNPIEFCSPIQADISCGRLAWRQIR